MTCIVVIHTRNSDELICYMEKCIEFVVLQIRYQWQVIVRARHIFTTQTKCEIIRRHSTKRQVNGLPFRWYLWYHDISIKYVQLWFVYSLNRQNGPFFMHILFQKICSTHRVHPERMNWGKIIERNKQIKFILICQLHSSQISNNYYIRHTHIVWRNDEKTSRQTKNTTETKINVKLNNGLSCSCYW